MLMSAGLPPPRRVFGHGFLTKDGLKMGKSLGNVLEPTALVGAYGADAVRYYFLREVVFGQVGAHARGVEYHARRARGTLPACLPACLPAGLPACLPACLPAQTPTHAATACWC
jgi:hypothetical protein